MLKGWAPKAGGTTFKVHLDGYNLLPYLQGKEPQSPRHEFFYFNDDAVLVAMRWENWKTEFCVQRQPGQFDIWAMPLPAGSQDVQFADGPFRTCRDGYDQWRVENAYIIQCMVSRVAPFLATFKEYPPSQRPASFTIDQMTEAIMKSLGG